MNAIAKIALYVMLTVGTVFFGHRFFTAFSQRMNQSSFQRVTDYDLASATQPAATDSTPAEVAGTNAAPVNATNTAAGGETNPPSATGTNAVIAKTTSAKPPKTGAQPPAGDRSSFLAGWGFLALLSLVALGLLAGHDVSQYLAQRVHRELFSDEGEVAGDPLYDQGEQLWANGEHLEAIRLMREYLQANPRRLHVSLRIAEIYEKDLNNPLAAALEYEEVLQHKFDPERWGWAAIHLCNLYNRLNQPQKTESLLLRVVSEHPETGAAKKARERLGLPEDDAGAGGEAGAGPEAGGPGKLPPGFKPKRG